MEVKVLSGGCGICCSEVVVVRKVEGRHESWGSGRRGIARLEMMIEDRV